MGMTVETKKKKKIAETTQIERTKGQSMVKDDRERQRLFQLDNVEFVRKSY